MSTTVSSIAVVVPAANEAERIDACLSAVAEAGAAVTHRVAVSVIVVLDRCIDDTAAIVARHPQVDTVSVSDRNVGVARGAGARHAVTRHGSRDGLWLANTDADSVVPVDWLARMLDLAESGADLVLGTVVPSGDLPATSRRRWSALYHAGAGHPHVHGANLGVGANALDAVGGWPPVTTGEDVDLVRRASQAELDIRRTARIPVVTSARTVGRAPSGFSSYLRALDHVDGPCGHAVPCP